ncbi:AraC family transcriptional regulator [Paenibacillus sp. Soil766]|uniref:helix-turn-helix transcriptional regulator n=1 Tax=Paenibacillus sp. Soil766 TaxID=1736404 RepID=UPI00070E00A1|nr:AraC family transcriptional regulator [Paenibacillus sp. Soil766]KRF06591.1 AraC family transcriptional regulator [Paenibacillus sp. Soil766]
MNGLSHIWMELPPLPYYLMIGLSTYRPGEMHPSRRHLGIFDLLWVTKGTLYIGEDDKEWEVAEGQALLLLPDRYHYPVRGCDTETVFYWIHFDFHGVWQQTPDQDLGTVYPQQVRKSWENPYRIRIPQYSAPPEFALAERHLRKLLTDSVQHRSETYWSEQQLFMELLRLLEAGQSRNDASPALILADKVEAYLRQHYQSDVTNSSLAEEFHFHPNYIVRCMKEIYDCTPMAYLHDYRIEQAKLLLIKTEWSIARIAEHIGFLNAPYFSNCFKAAIGISPLRFRKQYSA